MTPTPGDLSARLLACAKDCDFYSPDQCATLIDGIGWISMQQLLTEAAAALSALPAAGGLAPVLTAYRCDYCAGKGVDDVLADMRRTTPGDDEHIEALLADYADKIEAALTRQPATCECAECRRKRALARNGSPFIMDPLPERDASKPNSEQGRYRKFDVRRTDGSDEPGGKHHGCEYFVLDVKHDPLARAALAGYADAAEATHPQLAADLRERYTLTRQPVAGDGMVLVPRDEIDRAVKVLRYAAHPNPSPNADALAQFIATAPLRDPDLCPHGNHPADGCATCAVAGRKE